MKNNQFKQILNYIVSLYPNEVPVPLHAPRFTGNEKRYLAECIDSTYVSYVGRFVSDFEDHIKHLTGLHHAVAMVNGTAALQIMLMSASVNPGDVVITQALTFAATAAGIVHAGAQPAFVDVDRETLGMSPESLKAYLRINARSKPDGTYDNSTGRKIAAVMPMHTFGHPVRIEEIAPICEEYGLQLLEDAAESLGSYYKGKHTGTFGRAAILSFNGNKLITTGGGGMLITNDGVLAERARHLSTTAKKVHRWEFVHDEVGYNLRMPNVNAAIGCAQMESLEIALANKRETAGRYESFFNSIDMTFIVEPEHTRSNYWLNAILLTGKDERNAFLEMSNDNGVQTRPAWTLMTELDPYRNCSRIPVPNAEWIEDRLVNIPSSLRK